jgi:hypothetical protein
MGGRDTRGPQRGGVDRPAQRTRLRVYVGVRLAAAVLFVLSVTVLPPGIPAALCVVLAGVAGVATCFGTNAGGPGERAGARPQDRWFDAHTAPQGQWPPYAWPPAEARPLDRPAAPAAEAAAQAGTAPRP